MKLLLIKTSSLGDVLHALPALTEAREHIPTLACDWVVEEAYADIPAWHPAVGSVLPVAIRRWRRAPFAAWRSGEAGQFLSRLRAQRYDCVLDAQGLLKTAPVTLLARGPRVGFDRRSAREGLASFCYDRTVPVDRREHAVERLRTLFAAALGYAEASGIPFGFGIIRHAGKPGFPPLRILAKGLKGGGNMPAVHLAGAVGGDIFLGFISAVAFATILAVVAGLTITASASFAHDIYVNVIKDGHADQHEQEHPAAGDVGLAEQDAGDHQHHPDIGEQRQRRPFQDRGIARIADEDLEQHAGRGAGDRRGARCPGRGPDRPEVAQRPLAV